MDEKHLGSLAKIVGSRFALTDADSLSRYGHDATKGFSPSPAIVLLPANTSEVQRIVRYCFENYLPIVPNGGRTGLAAGAVAAHQEVVLALDRLCTIEPVDKVGMTLRVGAGATTHAVQQAAKDAGLFFGLDLASRGSSQIGGNLSTNAGGLKFIRYGGAREQVLGLEVVLPDGELLDINSSLRKNNTGYDLKHLFIGAEGTLGIITAATLRLVPAPGELNLACCAVSRFEQITQLLALSNRQGVALTAFEFLDTNCLKTVLQFHPQCRNPFSQEFPYLVLIEAEKNSHLEALLADAFEKGIVEEGTVSTSSIQFTELWALRENISEAASRVGRIRKNDISIPIHLLPDYVADLKKIFALSPPEITLLLFGHIGDGNIHINYVSTGATPESLFLSTVTTIEKQVFGLVKKYRGSISAEHGIGLLKRQDLHYVANPIQIALMKTIKQALDPHGIMNPGKIF